jgi:hypothetical protein
MMKFHDRNRQCHPVREALRNIAEGACARHAGGMSAILRPCVLPARSVHARHAGACQQCAPYVAKHAEGKRPAKDLRSTSLPIGDPSLRSEPALERSEGMTCIADLACEKSSSPPV